MTGARDGNGLHHPRKLIHFNTAGQAPASAPVVEYVDATTAESARALSRAHFAEQMRPRPWDQPSGQMVEVNTDELDEGALAWAVAIAEGRTPHLIPPCYGLPWRVGVMFCGGEIAWRPERDWLQTGPLLDQWAKGFGMVQDGKRETFRAYAYEHEHYLQRVAAGPSIQVAACRARVKVVIGDTVSIPAELAVYLGA